MQFDNFLDIEKGIGGAGYCHIGKDGRLPERDWEEQAPSKK
jgi:hypothetical protein